MKSFVAIFTGSDARISVLAVSLAATPIQEAIDEAKADCIGAEKVGADRIDILRNADIVEIVGIGADSYMT